MPLKVIVDQPIGEAAGGRQDGLGFHDYARVLANAAMNTDGPFTIGIFGDWGTGKTSLMRLMKEELDSRDNVISVWFNAWRYEREEHPLVPLVGTIVRELEQRARKGSALSGTIRSVARALRAVAYGFSATARLKMPGFAEVEASFVARDMIDRDEALTPDPLLDRSLYYGAFTTLDEAKLDGMRIVILIDDLDRCFPDKAIELLESIKLVLAQPGFIFALGVSQKVLEDYLAYRYENAYGIAKEHSTSYLDKIVQLPYLIPEATERMDEFCAALMNDQDDKTKENLRLVLPQVGQAIGGNPRVILRFFNNLLVDEALSEGSGAQIPIQFFAITRCLRQRWPERLADIEGSDALAETVIKWVDDGESLRAEAVKHDGPFVQFAKELISDTKFQQLLSGKEGRQWLEDSARRSASIKFLRGQRRLTDIDVVNTAGSYDVFLSYPMQDTDLAAELTAELTAKFSELFGLRVFSSATFSLGDDRVQRISSGLSRSGVICVLVGEQLSDDDKVIDEVYAARDANPAIRIIPVLVRDATPNDLPRRLYRLQWKELNQGDRDIAIKELARFIRRER